MPEHYSIYLALQEIDAERLAVEKQLALYPEKLAALERRVAEARGRVEALEAEQQEGAAERRRLEKQIADHEERIKRHEEQRMRVTNEKQLAAVEHEIATIREKISPLEDRDLEILLRADELEVELPKARAALDAIENEAATERARIAEQVASKKETLERLEKDRARFLARLDPPQRSRFEAMSERHPGSVLAPVTGEVCGHCHTALLPNVKVAVRRDEDMVQCEHCHRLLYDPEKVERL